MLTTQAARVKTANFSDSANLVRLPDVDALVRELRRCYIGAGVQLAIDMGHLIVERIFGGDSERWKSRGRKDISFRRLEKHPDLPFHASTLSRAVAIYMLSQRRGDLCTFKNISPSHLREIAPLPELEQDVLLDKVETFKWSMRRLREEISSKIGRRTRARPDQGLAGNFRRTLADFNQATLAFESRRIEKLRPDEARELRDLARTILQNMEIVAKKLAARAQTSDGLARSSDVMPARLAAPQHSSSV